MTWKKQVNTKGLGVLLLSLTLVGCSTSTPEPTILDEKEFQVNIPKPQPLQLRDIEWRVLNTDNGTYFALTTKEYEELGLNMQDILRFIRESKAYIEAVEDEPTEQSGQSTE